MKGFLKKEQGAVTIVEAAFVFPITFFVVLFMIMAGEGYYQFCRVEYTVTAAAIDGAARCENPMLGEVIRSGSVQKDPTKPNVMPYRYIFTGEAKNIARDVENDLRKKINGFEPLLFRGMKPTKVSVSTDLHMNVLVSSLPITCSFEIPLPIRFIFSNSRLSMKYSVRTSAAISDPAEFVRNVAMIKDLLERSEKAVELAQRAGKLLDKFAKITN